MAVKRRPEVQKKAGLFNDLFSGADVPDLIIDRNGEHLTRHWGLAGVSLRGAKVSGIMGIKMTSMGSCHRGDHDGKTDTFY